MRNFIKNIIFNLNKKQIIDVLKTGKKLPQDAALLWKDDKDVMLTAIKQDPYVLLWVSQRLKKDKDVVLAAIEQQGQLLMYASDILKDNEDVVSAAIKNNPLALVHASEHQQNQLIHLRAIKGQSDKFDDGYSYWYTGRMEALDILEDEEWMKKNTHPITKPHLVRKF